MTDLSPIKSPKACSDCGDVANDSHTCEDTPVRNTPHIWSCWGCYDTDHNDLCLGLIAIYRHDNMNMCLCCTSTDFAEDSLLCKKCNEFAHVNPEIVNYDLCDSGCGRFGMFTMTCQFCANLQEQFSYDCEE